MKKRIKKFFRMFMLAMICIIAFIIGSGYMTYREALQENPLNQRVNEVMSSENYVSYDALPKTYINAVVAVEDRRFFTRNSAIDWQSLARATWTNIRTLSLSEGASTLPQQVSKNLYWDFRTDINQKIAQMFMMNTLEKNYSKEDIFALYVNIIYFGDGYTGIYQASMGYFNVAPQDLSDAQATLLAGLPQSPSVYQLSTGLDLAKKRQRHVLDWMVKEGYFTETYADEIYQDSLNIKE